MYRRFRNPLLQLKRKPAYKLGQQLRPGLWAIAVGGTGETSFTASWAQSVSIVDTTAYNQVVGSVSGRNGTPPYTYSKVSGDAELIINTSNGEITYNGTADVDAPASAVFRASDSGPDDDVDVTVTLSVGLMPISSVTWSPADRSLDPRRAPVLVSTANVTGIYPPFTLTNISIGDYSNPAGTELWLDNPNRAYQTDTINCRVRDARGQTFQTSITVVLEASVAETIFTGLIFDENGEYTLGDPGAVDPKADAALVLGEDGLWRAGSAGVPAVWGNSSGARQVKQLLADGAAPATETVTVVSGETYTLQGTGTYDYALTGAHTGSLAGSVEHKALTFTASTTSLTITVNTAGDTWQLEMGDLPSEIVDGPRNSVKLFDYLNGNTVDANGIVTEAQGPKITDPTRVSTNRIINNSDPQLAYSTGSNQVWGAQVPGPIAGTQGRELMFTDVAGQVTALLSGYIDGELRSHSVWLRAQSGTLQLKLGNPGGQDAVTVVATTTWQRFGSEGYVVGSSGTTGTAHIIVKADGITANETFEVALPQFDRGPKVTEQILTFGEVASKVYANAGTHITVDGNGIVTEGTPYNEYPVLYPYQRAYPASGQALNQTCNLSLWTQSNITTTLIPGSIVDSSYVAGFQKSFVEDTDGASEGYAYRAGQPEYPGVDADPAVVVAVVDKEPLNADGSWMTFAGLGSLNFEVQLNKETGATRTRSSLPADTVIVESIGGLYWRIYIESTMISTAVPQMRIYPAQMPTDVASPESVGSVTVHYVNVWGSTPLAVAKGLPPVDWSGPIALAGQTTWPIDVLGTAPGFDETRANMVTMEVKPDFDLNRAVADNILGTDAPLLRGAAAGTTLESNDGTDTASVAVGADTTATPVLVAVIASKTEDSLQVRISGANGTPTTHSGTYNTGTLLRLFQSLTATAGARNLQVITADTAAELEAKYDADYAGWLPAREVPHVQVIGGVTQYTVTVPTFLVWDQVTVRTRPTGSQVWELVHIVTSSPEVITDVDAGVREYEIEFSDTGGPITATQKLAGQFEVLSQIAPDDIQTLTLLEANYAVNAEASTT